MGIWDSAFYGCTSLTSITIPASVTSIGWKAFSNCNSLLSIAVDTANAYYASIDGVLFNKALTTLVQCPGGKAGTIVIPGSVTAIGWDAFSGCNSLLSIAVDAANAYYASIDGVLFNKALTTLVQCPGGKAGTIVIPASITNWGYQAFSSCSKLTSVYIQDGVKNIGYSAFSGCSGLASVTIPASVTDIGWDAFSNCSALKALYFLGTPPASGWLIFSSPPPSVYRLPSSPGWGTTYADAPVKVFQPISIGPGQEAAVSLASSFDRLVKTGAGTAILTAASTRTGGTVLEAGELVVRDKYALGTGLLEVQAGAKATLETGFDTVSVTSLSLAGTSRLEMSTGRLAVAANGFHESDIRSWLIAGRNNGTWDGTYGITSTFAGGDRAIGYRVVDGALEMACAAPGDSNLDGVIDILDLGEILSAGRFNTGETANWQQGDTNYDGVFDLLDLSEILGTGLFNQGTYVNQGGASSAAAETSSAASFDQSLVFAALASEQKPAGVKARR